MPLLLQCDEIEPGMRLHEALFWHGRILLTGGKTLTHADVDSLRRKYPDLRIRVSDPILDDVIDFENDSREREVASTAQKKIAACMSEVTERFSSRASVASMNVAAIHGSVSEVIAYLDDNPVSAALLSRSLGTENYLSEHAGNIFYLSMILGCAVRDYIDTERRRRTACRWLDLKVTMDLVPLGLGAMFADIGMYPLQHLYGSDEPLSEDDRQSIREHPEAGASMVPADFSPIARSVIRTHHENFDGTGYPNGENGENIHVFSRIIRIADAYDAATATHIYRQAKSSARALWEMTKGPFKRFYDPVLTKVFARLIQPFPIGAKLRLRDGRLAVVVRYNRTDPFKPDIVIAFDVNGKPLPHAKLEGPLHLADRQDLRIQAFADEELSYLYSRSPVEDATPMRQDFITLFDSAFP